jgi:hypothetical protein
MTRFSLRLPLVIAVLAVALVSFAQSPPAVPSPKTVDAILVDALNNKGLLTADQRAQITALLAAAQKPTTPTYPTFHLQTQVDTRFSAVQTSSATQPAFGSPDNRAGGDGFNLNRARFLITGDGTPTTSYRVLLLVDNGIASPVAVVAQVVDHNWTAANVAAGQLCPPYGFERLAEESDIPLADTSVLTNCLVPGGGYGARLLSKEPLPGKINYMVTVTNGKGKFASAENHSYQLAGRFDRPVGKDLSVALDVAENPNTTSTPYSSVFLSGNGDPYGLMPAYTAGTVTQKWIGGDAQWHKDANTIWAEYTASSIDPHSSATVNANAYYVTAVHALPSGNDPQKVELVAGYQHFDPNTTVKDQYDLTAYTAGINVQLNGSRRYTPAAGQTPNSSLLRLNYVWNHEGAGSVRNDKFIVEYQNWF